MVVVENTPDVHNLVVCTLCSCYPWPVLGLPPRWYKAPAYRSRAVREPRALLAEMGTTMPDDVEIRVWDSSAEVRYLVLPERPAGTDGLAEDELADARHARLDDRRVAAVTEISTRSPTMDGRRAAARQRRARLRLRRGRRVRSRSPSRSPLSSVSRGTSSAPG